MSNLYARWMDHWEWKLATRDNNRVVRPFEWGLDWLSCIGYPGCPANANGDAPHEVGRFSDEAVAGSDRFFAYRTPGDFRLEGESLTFTSPVPSPYPENNRVHAAWLPRGNERAVVVLPQWNAGDDGHLGLCKLLNRFGISALRMSMAYHARRMPGELQRADYHVSSNIGRTVHAARQSVIDVRACLDWLESQGFRRLGVLGTSLGSCIAFIAAAHDSRIRTGVFNHVSMYFSDVVWTGISTRHVRQALAEVVKQEELRRYWSPISPASYLDRMNGRDLNSLLIWARHDSTFLPEFSLQVLEWFRTRELRHEVFTLPCGHYTTGKFPFNIMDGLAMCRFLRRNL